MNSLNMYHAKKRFGQNFLIDQHLIQEILEVIFPKETDSLIEIGPGLGALTYPILKMGYKLTAIELDRDLIEYLQASEYAKTQQLTIIPSDVLRVNFTELYTGQKLKVVGNLPYNIITPLLFHLFTFANIIDSMYFMVQKEIADRLTATVNEKAYGKLSIMGQYFAEVYDVIYVPKESFSPAPKVESSFIQLIPKRDVDYALAPYLEKVVTQAFSKRRKKITNSLDGLFTKEQLEELAIDLNLRAENIAQSDYVRLAKFLMDNE